MGYQLEREETPGAGIRRIAREQLANALVAIEKISTAKAGVAVHETRKRLKKLRALLRLIRDELGEQIFDEENNRLRDVGHSLSAARDAQVQLNVLEKSRQRAGLPKSTFRKTTVVLRREIAAASTEMSAEQAAAKNTLLEIGDRLEGWPLDHLNLENLCGALKRFYRRGCKALRCAESEPTPENFHSWRKRVKDVWYQARLLQGLNPVVLCEIALAAKLLGRHLGELHDLAFLREKLAGSSTFPESETKVLLGLLCAHESELEETALELGARFFAEKPKAFKGRLLRYAKARPTVTAVST